jgi:hypothetical protein
LFLTKIDFNFGSKPPRAIIKLACALLISKLAFFGWYFFTYPRNSVCKFFRRTVFAVTAKPQNKKTKIGVSLFSL